MGIGLAIFSKLSTDSNVAPMVQDSGSEYGEYRIEPGTTPIGDVFPQLIYDLDNLQPERSYGGGSNLDSVTIRILCVSKQYLECDTLAGYVRNALSDQSGVWGGVTVLGAFLQNDIDDKVLDTDSSAILYYTRELSFLVWYRPS